MLDDTPIIADLIEDILPAESVHLFGGPSGAGKTRWLFQRMLDLCEGKDILDHKVPKPLTVGYVALDRPIKSILKTFKALGIDPDHPNFTIVSCATKSLTLVQIPALFDTIPDLILLDGIPTLLPSGDINKYHEVASFLKLCQKICEQYHTTIIGILHATKTKENERYLNPRQRIAGSVAWAAYSETIFVLEPIKPENSNDKRRTLWVLPRNSAEFTVDYTFNSQGQLVELKLQEEQDKYSILLQLIPTDKSITRDHILDLAFNLGIGRAQCDAWLAKTLEDGSIFKPEYGRYQRRKPN